MTVTWGVPGGANSPAWSDRIKIHVWVALARGNTWTLGPHPFDRLDAGNVLARAPEGATPTPEPDPTTGTLNRLWVDVSEDVADLTIATGATKADGVFARAEAGTATITLADPDRQWDPLNTNGRWMYQGRSRLAPGTPVLIWTESLQFGTFIIRHTLFCGTVDSWRTPWTPHASERKTVLQCSDATSDLVARQRPEVAPVGAGETVTQRIVRILDYHDGPALIGWGATPHPDILSDVTEQATTMPGTCWEQLQRAADDEIGFVYVTPYYADPLDALTLQALVGVRFLPRSVWLDNTEPAKTFACPMLIAATTTALDLQLRNRVTSQRKDGTAVTVRSAESINRYGEVGYSKTDLGLKTDDEAAQWAAFVLMQFAYPRAALSDVTLLPAAEPDRWVDVLGVDLVSERVRIDWTPPGTTDTYSVNARVIGVTHSINWDRWQVRWTLGAAEAVAPHWTLGPDPHDALDAGYTFA